MNSHPAAREDEIASAVELIVRGPDAVRGIRQLSSLAMTQLLDNPMFRSYSMTGRSFGDAG